MTAQEQETEIVAAVQNWHPGTQQRKYHVCLGCGGTQYKGSGIHCPVYYKVYSATTRWVILPEFAGGNKRLHQQLPINNSSQPVTNAIHLQLPQGDHLQLYNIAGNKAELAPISR